MKDFEIKKFINDNKNKLPLSYNDVVFRKNVSVINQTENQIKKSGAIKQFYKPITRF